MRLQIDYFDSPRRRRRIPRDPRPATIDHEDRRSLVRSSKTSVIYRFVPLSFSTLYNYNDQYIHGRVASPHTHYQAS